MTNLHLADASPSPEIVDGLRRMGLLGAADAVGERLVGGVSSEIWRIDLPSGPVCVKRALAKLRVAADWRAPVDRNRYEARWMARANEAVPGSAPRLLGQDEFSGALAMEYLSPQSHKVWKSELRDGNADPVFAAQVADSLGRIHASTSRCPELALEFPTDQIFYDIRLEPYLVATARAHADLAPYLNEAVTTTQANKRALVHGDVSPKNILCGPRGPVFLDAECAWWGDPAFDLAFCLNHLLLKCLWTPASREGFLKSFDALATSYRAHVTWELPGALETRAARLLPCLLLARVDGKSPVEYITAEADKNRVRHAASALLRNPVDHLRDIRTAWEKELAG